MTARLDATALHHFLSQLWLTERTLAEQYRRTARRCTGSDLAVSLTTAADGSDRRAGALERLMVDLGMGGPSAAPLPAVIAAVQHGLPPGRAAGGMTALQDYQGLLMAELWRHEAVSCLRAVAGVTGDQRLASAAESLDDQSMGRINWLQGLTACCAAGTFAPQQTGTPLRRSRSTRSVAFVPRPLAERGHADDFTTGPNATPVERRLHGTLRLDIRRRTVVAL